MNNAENPVTWQEPRTVVCEKIDSSMNLGAGSKT